MTKNAEQNATLESNITGVLKLQAVASIVILLIVYCLTLLPPVWEIQSWKIVSFTELLTSSAYGALLAIIGTLLSARSIRRSAKASDDELVDGQGHLFMVPVFSGLLNKLVIVGGGIAFGLVVLNLIPMLVIASYLIVQITSAIQLLR
jgi:hypothetical protein